MVFFLSSLAMGTSRDAPTVDDLADPREWLENVEGASALNWVKEKNADALSFLGDPKDDPVYKRILAILDSKEKIPYIGRVLNGLYYNFWQDEVHVRGVWRRCTLAEYKKEVPAWEIVLDLDALSKAEGKTWVWAGSIVLDEGPDTPTDRVLIKLSDGGADATHVRELDINTKLFIPASDTGFILPEAKWSVAWKDRDTLLVGGSGFGDAAVTDSGYARTVREWKRGTPHSSAVEVYAGERADVAVHGYTYLDRSYRYSVRVRALTFYTSRHEVLLGPEGYGAALAATGYKLVHIPADAELGTFADQVLVTLRTAWLGFAAGALLAAPAQTFLEVASSPDDEATLKPLFTPLFEPSDTASLDGMSESKSYVILNVLDNVRSENRFWKYDRASGKWSLQQTLRGQGVAQISASGVNGDKTDEIWTTSSSYTQPTTYSIATADKAAAQERLKALPAFFDASGLESQQFDATSLDGTRVPYFLVRKMGAKLDGTTPTLLYGYGGFEISMTPGYAATVGVGWLESGGAYAVANIRGGGEFGPRWHQAALKEKRHKAYEDFEAVAIDLVKRGVTSPQLIGCEGGSNGGLLTGNMLARSPHLFGAIVIQVPLLDMKRFNKLLAGASWMGEYGDPDKPDEWAFLQKYSPYHTVKQGATAPPTLFTTSTRDDRVHPGHARKLAGKMYDLGLPVLSYENVEGGHGGAADNKQRAFMSTLTYAFLRKALVEASLASALAKRPARDGGRRRLANVVYRLQGPLKGFRGLPKWVAPALSAIAFAALAVMQTKRLR